MMKPSVRRCPPYATLLGAALLSAAPAALAAQAPAGAADTVPQYQVEGVTVTVGRSAARRDALPRQVEVVTRTDLERTPARELADVLKKQAAVDVIQFPGLLSGVAIRGFRPQFSGITQRTLLLVDGRPAGATNASLLDLQDLERIEVLKGPASALYGSSAMGGVVNLIPRRSTGPVRSTATVGYGSWATRQASLRSGGNLASNVDFDLTVSTLDQRDDYRVGDGNLFRGWLGDTVVVRTFGDSTSLSPERGDGEVRPFTQYDTRSGSARFGYTLSSDWRLDWRAEGMRADGVQNPGDMFAEWGDSRSLKNVERTSSDLGLSGTREHHTMRIRAYTAAEQGENFNAPEETDQQPHFINLQTWTRTRGLQLEDVVSLGRHSLIGGFDYTRVRAQSERFGAPGERIAPWEPDSEIRSRAVFAEAQLRSEDERLVATFGARYDRIGFRVHETELWDGGLSAANRESFSVLNPSFGLQYTTVGGVRVHGSGGRAFVAPTAFNVAGQVVRRDPDGGVHLTVGNPDLDPENSFTWDVGIGVLRLASGVDLDVTYFRTRVRDRITFVWAEGDGETTRDGEPVLSRASYANADEAEIEGLEWRLAYDLGARAARRFVLRPYVSATHLLRAEETVGVQRDIRNLARRTLNFGIDFDDLQRFSTRLAGRYVGSRTDDDWNVWPAAEVGYPAFLTLDLSNELRVGDRYRLGFDLTNLTDENYYEVRGYPLPGRSLQVRLSAMW